MCLQCNNCNQQYYCRLAKRQVSHFDTYKVLTCDVNFQWIDTCFGCDQPK